MRNIILLIMMGVAVSAHCESQYESLFGKADDAIARQDWGEAEKIIHEALQLEPGNAGNVMLLSNLGMIQFYSGRDSLAIATLTDAHRMAPESVTVLANRARVLTSSGKINEAIADYDTIERLDSMAWQPRLYRGLIRLSEGKIEEAAEDLNRLQSLRPNDIETHIALAALAEAEENPQKAVEHFNILIKADPQPEYYAGRAMCLIQLGFLADAADDIASGIERDEDCAELFVCRALLNRKRYRRDDALHDAHRAISLGANPERVKALLEL